MMQKALPRSLIKRVVKSRYHSPEGLLVSFTASTASRAETDNSVIAENKKLKRKICMYSELQANLYFTELQRELSSMAKWLAVTQNSIVELNMKLCRKNQTIQHLKSQENALQRELQLASKAALQLQAQLQSCVQEKNQRLKHQLKSRASKPDYSQLEEENQSLRNQLELMKNVVDQGLLQQSEKELSHDLSTNEGQTKQDQKETIAALRKSIQTREKQAEQFRSSVLAERDKQISQLQETLQSKSREIGQLREKASAMKQNQMATLNAFKADTTRRIQSLELQLQKSREEEKKGKAQAEAVRIKFTAAQAQLKGKLAALQQKLVAANEEISRGKAEIGEQKKIVQALQRDKKGLAAQVATYKELQAVLSRKENELKQARAGQQQLREQKEKLGRHFQMFKESIKDRKRVDVEEQLILAKDMAKSLSTMMKIKEAEIVRLRKLTTQLPPL